MFWVEPKEKGATPEEIPNPGQSKLIVVITMPVLVRFVIVMLLLPEAFPMYVFAKEREAGLEEMSVVCARAVAARMRNEQMPSVRIRRVNNCISPASGYRNIRDRRPTTRKSAPRNANIEAALWESSRSKVLCFSSVRWGSGKRPEIAGKGFTHSGLGV